MRICPECDARTPSTTCPKCGTKTLREQPPEGADPLLGRVFDGRYRLESLVGRGGMGSVYRAVHTGMNQILAVKVIRGERAADVRSAKRFHREAKAASQLFHPHTIRVTDFGQTEDGDLYLAMEFLAGRTLTRLLKDEGPLPAGRAMKIAAEVAGALAEAHSIGLAHRDLKPDNIMLLDVFGDRDFVKVLDFGIAKFMAGDTEETLTHTGTAIGTPQYMAPEQARGRSLTPGVDVYSLGIIVFQMLTGVRPFDGTSGIEILMAHINDPVPDLPAAFPEELRALVRAALSKEPSERPAAADLIERFGAIRSAFAGMPAIPAPPRAEPAEAETAIVDNEQDGVETAAVPETPSQVKVVRQTGHAPRAPAGTIWYFLVPAAVVSAVGLAVVLAVAGDDDSPQPAVKAMAAEDAPQTPAAPAEEQSPPVADALVGVGAVEGAIDASVSPPPAEASTEPGVTKPVPPKKYRPRPSSSGFTRLR